MFKELEIKNFKSIGHAKFEFGKINVLTGPSNLGKSNVVQAIYCLTHNHWDSNYLKWGEKKCTISLVDENGESVTYIHDTSASYFLSTCDQPFTKIGKTVPQEVQDFLKMNLVAFDEDLELDFNFERQFDPSFIISLSGFELAKVFGKLMNLDIVLSAARNISKDVMAINKKKDGFTAIQDAAVDYIQNNYRVELKYALAHTAQNLEAQADALDQKNQTLFNLLVDYDYYASVIEELTDLLKTLEQVDQIVEPVPGLGDVLSSFLASFKQVEFYHELLAKSVPQFDFGAFGAITQWLLDYYLTLAKLSSYQSLDSKLSNVDYSLIDGITNLETMIGSVTMAYSSIDSVNAELQDADLNVKNKTNEFNDFLHENNICPYTNQPFTSACIESIIASA